MAGHELTWAYRAVPIVSVEVNGKIITSRSSGSRAHAFNPRSREIPTGHVLITRVKRVATRLVALAFP